MVQTTVIIEPEVQDFAGFLDGFAELSETILIETLLTTDFAGRVLAPMIRERVQSGRATDGSLRAYRPATVADRARRGLQTSPANLTRTGSLLGALTGGEEDGLPAAVFEGSHPDAGVSNETLAGWLEGGTKRMLPWTFVQLSLPQEVLVTEGIHQVYEQLVVPSLLSLFPD